MTHPTPYRMARHPVAAAATLLCALAAQAQTTPAPEENQTVDRIVITAQKREQAAIDVPASVSTVSADRLQRSGAVRLEDYAAQVPGMSITALSRGYTSVVLRGISTGISQATPSTAYYIDEAPIGSINAYAAGSTLTPDLDPYDLRRIEVLKGPQGTLYGAGAVGGLLRYVTVQPDSSRFGGSISLGGHKISQGGSGHEARASLNVPVNTDLALRFSALDRDDAGYIDNPVRHESDVNKATTRGGRVALGWTISPDWSLQAWALTQQFRAGGIGAEDLVMPGVKPLTRELEHGSNVAEKQAIDLNVVNATLKGRLGGFDLVSSTTVQKVKADTTVDVSQSFGALLSILTTIPNIGAQTHQQISTRRWSEEVRLRASALAEKLDYEFGLFVTDEDSSNRLPPEDVFLNPGAVPFSLGQPLANASILSKYREYSAFGNATYAVTPEFDLMGGLRLSRDEQKYDQDYQTSLLTPAAVLINQEVAHSKVTYLLSGRYKPARDTAIYGRLATGYRPGGPSALPPNLGKTSFDPDTLTSAEIGFKSTFAGGKASIEAAIFSTNWKGVQIQTQTANFQHFVNGGDARSQGAEATLLWFPVAGLTLRTTAGTTDAKLTQDAPAAGGVNGDRMPFVPKVTASFAVDQRFAVGNGWQGWLGASVAHIGERRSNFSGKGAFDVPAYTTLGLNGGVESGAIRVTAYVKNATDVRGINFMNNLGLKPPFSADPNGNPYAAGVIQPRTVGVDLGYRF
jgi:outer membrane receptor protein involved in Fe transport